MKLIDADNFDERMRIAVGMCEYEVTEDFKEGVQATLTMLKTEPVIQPYQWIPVTERLPEKVGMYQVTNIYGNVVRYVFNCNESSENYWKRCVKAWMPLPKPYREEQTDERTE